MRERKKNGLEKNLIGSKNKPNEVLKKSKLGFSKK